jgi:serine/threonine protein kinase
MHVQLWAEIKLHQMLAHPHVVRFEDCFEDAENVYMVLELCDNGVSRSQRRCSLRIPVLCACKTVSAEASGIRDVAVCF